MSICSPAAPLIGRYVTARCTQAGVHSGVLADADGPVIRMTDSRRLYYWRAAQSSFTLSGVAVHRLAAGSKISLPVEHIVLTEVCEIIACSDEAQETIKSFAAHQGLYV